MKNQLTYSQGYKSMYFFLCGYQTKNPLHEDLSSLLGDLLFIERDDKVSTSDPASWDDWIYCMNKIIASKQASKQEKITYFQAFKTMFMFLSEYHKRTHSDEISIILTELSPTASGSEESPYDPNVWQRWLSSIQKGLQAKSSAG